MRIAIWIDKATALLAGQDKHGRAVVNVPAADEYARVCPPPADLVETVTKGGTDATAD